MATTCDQQTDDWEPSPPENSQTHSPVKTTHSVGMRIRSDAGIVFLLVYCRAAAKIGSGQHVRTQIGPSGEWLLQSANTNPVHPVPARDRSDGTVETLMELRDREGVDSLLT